MPAYTKSNAHKRPVKCAGLNVLKQGECMNIDNVKLHKTIEELVFEMTEGVGAGAARSRQ